RTHHTRSDLAEGGFDPVSPMASFPSRQWLRSHPGNGFVPLSGNLPLPENGFVPRLGFDQPTSGWPAATQTSPMPGAEVWKRSGFATLIRYFHFEEGGINT